MDNPDENPRRPLPALSIRLPDADNSALFIDRLCLDRLPSRQDVHSAIERNLLTPKQNLPQHWLSRYQL